MDDCSTQGLSVNALLSKDGGVLACEQNGHYPSVDLSIWLRSCAREPEAPVEAERVRGRFPSWLSGGCLLLNGPGKFRYGDQTVEHLFDGSALMQKFEIANEGRGAFYQCRFLRSTHFKRNLSAQKIVTTEFATAASRTEQGVNAGKAKKRLFFHQLQILMRGNLSEVMSDNTFITVYPLGSEYFCFYESPFVHRLDPFTLATTARIDLNRRLGLLANSAHPHFDEWGNMFSVGLKVGLTGPEYTVNKFPVGHSSLEGGHQVAKVQSRWMLDPAYMHSFAMTARYFILIEQPFTVHVPSMVSAHLRGMAVIETLKWRGNKSTVLHVVDRSTGEKTKLQYHTKAFFFLHIINAYEDSNHLVIDISCYNNAAMLDCMYLSALQTAQSDENYARTFRGRPMRFVIPLRPAAGDCKDNLVTLSGTTATATWMKKGRTIWVNPQMICNVGCETPTINYARVNGKKYRYFYAITSDVDDPVSSGRIYKVDTLTGQVTSWYQRGLYCSEPTFVPRPRSCENGGMPDEKEDDGILISSSIFAAPESSRVALIALDASTMTEVARAEFRLDGPVPKPLHGYFTGNNKFAGVQKNLA